MRKLLHPNNRPNNIFSHYKRIIYQVLLDRMAAVKTTGQIEYGKAISVVNLSAAICAVRINASSNPVSMSRSLSYSARLRFRCAWQLVVVEIDPHIRWVLTSPENCADDGYYSLSDRNGSLVPSRVVNVKPI